MVGHKARGCSRCWGLALALGTATVSMLSIGGGQALPFCESRGHCHQARWRRTSGPRLRQSSRMLKWTSRPAGQAAQSPFGMGTPPEPTDKFITDRIPWLARYKMAIMGAIFCLAYYKGWVGPWGLVFGFQSRSYFDILGIPLRVLPQSPFCGSPYIYCQFYSDLIVRSPKLIRKAPSFIRSIIDGSFVRRMEEKMEAFAQQARQQASQPQSQGSFKERMQEVFQQAQQTQQAQQRAQQPPPWQSAGEWQTAQDPKSGRIYYWNTRTRETRWDRPGAADSPRRPAGGDVIDV
eukprot:TRINITY_DN51708_c0_g1_i1.p1 TRINITY_DN51708_c0_g1~~TRINITY_DN51708_c0_g1_i1.p1  ORF type:complete len:310 (-),score=41.75 TRINITY_DN51708_c0_g1_i1:59-934(-)